MFLQEKNLDQQTRAARLDPFTKDTLDKAFERLGLVDDDGHIRAAIACYSRDAIIEGIAIFEAKKKKGTLRKGVDARYLHGIIRNVEHRHESDAITLELLRLRLESNDRLLNGLRVDRAELAEGHPVIKDRLRAIVDAAMRANLGIDRLFWLETIAEAIISEPKEDQERLALSVSQRIHATLRINRVERCRAERIVYRMIWPVQ